MPLIFKKDDKFEDLGSIEEFLSKFGDCSVSIDNIDEPNIRLTIISDQEIEFKILCSNPLSDIIRQEGDFPQGMERYRILRITRNDRNSYIRVSQSIDIDVNQPNSEIEILENTLKGNKRFVLKIGDIKS